MDIYTEIIKFKKEHKVNNDALGEVVGKNGDALRKSLARKSLSELEIDAIRKFMKSTVENSISDYPIDKRFLETTEPNYEYQNIKNAVPYYDIEFTSSFLIVENNQQTRPDSYISHPFFKGCDFVARNSGQSMSKIIKHGDAIGLVEVKGWQDFFVLNEVYAIVTINNQRMVKIIRAGETPDSFTLISKPSDGKLDEFPPQQIKKDQILSIFKVQASSHLF